MSGLTTKLTIAGGVAPSLIRAMDQVTRGQHGGVSLPGQFKVSRQSGHLVIELLDMSAAEPVR